MKRNVHFLLILGILLLYYGVSGVFDEFNKNSDLIEAEGRIIGLHEKNASKNTAFHPIISFNDESGNEITFISKVGSHFYKNQVGEKIEIVYPSGYPEEARIKTSAARSIAPAVFLLSGTALFIMWFGEAYKHFK